MKHVNGFYYFAPLLRCDTIRDLQWKLTNRAEARDPRLLEMAKVNQPKPATLSACAVYIHDGQCWDRAHPELVRASYGAIVERCIRLFPRLLRSYEWAAKRNREYLATLTPEQARAAFNLYRDTGLDGKPWGLLWYEVLPPGITHQAAADALGEGFTVDHGWHSEGKRSVKRHSTFTPGAAKPRKSVMMAHRI